MRAAAVVALLSLFLAGCLAPATTTGDAGAAGNAVASVRTPVDVGACAIVEGVTFVPEDRVRPHVPDAFRPVVTPSGVQVIFGGNACDGARRAFVAVVVDVADERLRGDGVDAHYWEPEHAFLDGHAFADAAALARANGTPAIAIDVDASTPAPGIRVDGGAWSHAFTAHGGSPAPDAANAVRTVAGTFREWFPAHDGYGYLEGRFDSSRGNVGGAVGTLRAGDGTIARAILGGSAELTAIAITGASIVDAHVGFEPAST